MSFTRYQRLIRTECISRMGCTEADESLDKMGDECFLANADYHYRHNHPPTIAARAWMQGVTA